MNLPALKRFAAQEFAAVRRRRLLLLSEGFEERALAWVRSLPREVLFDDSVVFKNIPERASRLQELLPEVQLRSGVPPLVAEYQRFTPIESETTIIKILSEKTIAAEEVVVDISVMSKLLIMELVYGLRKYTGTVTCIYTEPVEYAPTKEEYETSKKEAALAMRFPSYGVHDVVRTPLLSSSVMHNRPMALVAFTSFNEQLIRSLLSTLCPAHLYLINGVPPHLVWREKATQEVHEQIIKEYERDNPVDEQGVLTRRASTLSYEQTFRILAQLYRDLRLSDRMVLAPTGSKMQSVACALLKIGCPDVHIEYPTTESFFVPGFSSSEVKEIHHLEIPRFAEYVRGIAESERLNG